MRDALGRRRQPTQNRGLRPLHPRLPAHLISRSIRIAMSATAWHRLDQITGVTRPRAIGEILERALQPQPDWQDWQIRKEKQLLDRAS
jgi:hypothetical protein